MNLDKMKKNDSLGGDLWRTAISALNVVENTISSVEDLAHELHLLQVQRDHLKDVIERVEKRWTEDLKKE